MIDTQTMIREVCEGLPARSNLQRRHDGLWMAIDESGLWSRFAPEKRHDHCHQLIDWMVEAGHTVDAHHWQGAGDGKKYCIATVDVLSDDRRVSVQDEDSRIAALTAVWRALKDE